MLSSNENPIQGMKLNNIFGNDEISQGSPPSLGPFTREKLSSLFSSWRMADDWKSQNTKFWRKLLVWCCIRSSVLEQGPLEKDVWVILFDYCILSFTKPQPISIVFKNSTFLYRNFYLNKTKFVYKVKDRGHFFVFGRRGEGEVISSLGLLF